MKACMVLVLGALSLVAGQVHAEECVGLSKILKGAATELSQIFSKSPNGVASFASVTVVADKIINRKKTGGRKLEEDKPLDVKVAQANLDAALKSPEVKARLEKARKDIPDEKQRLAYEASILDEEGYYSARELKIQQLLQRLN